MVAEATRESVWLRVRLGVELRPVLGDIALDGVPAALGDGVPVWLPVPVALGDGVPVWLPVPVALLEGVMEGKAPTLSVRVVVGVGRGEYTKPLDAFSSVDARLLMLARGPAA